MNRRTVRWISLIIAAIFIFGIVSSIMFDLAYATSTQQKINQQQQKKNEAQQKINAANTKSSFIGVEI